MIHHDNTIHSFIPLAMDSKNTILDAESTESTLARELQEDPLPDGIIPL